MGAKAGPVWFTAQRTVKLEDHRGTRPCTFFGAPIFEVVALITVVDPHQKGGESKRSPCAAMML